MDVEQLRQAVNENPVWYHTMELSPGLTTPGWFDLRPIVERMPWPDVRGKRCLDVGTYDGFLAFELERRGAAEVIATDLADHDQWDWPPDVRAEGPARLAELAGPKGRGFEIAAKALSSSVERVHASIYELSPERFGTFDVVVMGSLLLHLRDPLRALEAVRSVCGGQLLSADQINLPLTLFHPQRPAAQLNGAGELCQWWEPNAAGHRRMVFSAGFAIERTTRPYCIPYGTAHWRIPLSRQAIADEIYQRLLTGSVGVPHAALLARPRV